MDCNVAVFLGAGESCLLAAIFDFVAEKIGECSTIGIDRLGQKHEVEWVGANSSIFYISTLRYAGRTSYNAHPKENA